MSKLTNLCKRLVSEEDGLETVEYAIIAGIIVAATITTIVAIGGWVSGKFDELNTTLQGN